ncbi:MAG TPA: hypothetical protein VJL07_06475 [Dehalococcoidia bacterium]|nr:hypothetical protein [Dehalococcoidia bacterium]
MAEQTGTLKVGNKAPDFKLKGTGNTEFKLSDQRGRNVVLSTSSRPPFRLSVPAN